MKAIAIVLGIVLLVIAVVYFVVPADSLPAFFPGHDASLARVRVKHGILSAAAGVVLIGAGWWMGRR